MDRETLSNYGWITIVTLVLAVMLALATPFGTYVGDGVVSIARGYVATSEKKLNDDNVKEMGNKWDDKFENGVATEDTARPSGTLIPTGAKYTKADGTTLEGNGTNKFPDAPSSGDTYEEGDYIYTYNKGIITDAIVTDYGTEWSVIVKDKTKAEYGTILSRIAGKPMTHMRSTFYNCQSLRTAPTIPNSVTDIGEAFFGCSLLRTYKENIDSDMDFSNYKIPSSVTNMYGTFAYCEKLINAPEIPNGVTNMRNTFYFCTFLTTTPTIPSSVTDMTNTFRHCTYLTGTITINANPTKYDYCFQGTTKSITLTGSSSKLAEIAATTNGNVTVK